LKKVRNGQHSGWAHERKCNWYHLFFLVSPISFKLKSLIIHIFISIIFKFWKKNKWNLQNGWMLGLKNSLFHHQRHLSVMEKNSWNSCAQYLKNDVCSSFWQVSARAQLEVPGSRPNPKEKMMSLELLFVLLCFKTKTGWWHYLSRREGGVVAGSKIWWFYSKNFGKATWSKGPYFKNICHPNFTDS
jgi:hypothetical protein